jgi:hypothetical protein
VFGINKITHPKIRLGWAIWQIDRQPVLVAQVIRQELQLAGAGVGHDLDVLARTGMADDLFH